MGIPRFFKYILDRFPDVVAQTSFNQGFCAPERVDHLYLDANSIIHNCAHEIYYSSKPRLAQRLTPEPTPEEKELRLFKKIAGYMDQLLKFVKPKKLFYIAIDGVAPMAKQAQQRQRRYKSAAEKTEEEFATFDSNKITPGTEFMYRLGKYLDYYIRRQITLDAVWQQVRVIFSGANVPGEGEQKIVNYIRSTMGRNDKVHCMYGLDADLFMLSLATHCPKFYLLREDQFTMSWTDTFFYRVDIAQLRKDFLEEWGHPRVDIKRLIDDFLFVCFMVGNDFLHTLPPFHDLAWSIDFMMELRKTCLHGGYLVDGDTINLSNLCVLLKELAPNESQMLCDQYAKEHFDNVTMNSCLVNPEKPEWGVDINKYRKMYYAKAGIAGTSTQEVMNFCRQYIQGLEWVNYYYHHKPNNWGWMFKFHYSPLIIDLYTFLTGKMRISRVSIKNEPPILPFQQLLCVLPPRSKNLLPVALRPAYTRKELVGYYPQTFEIDLEGKQREWEGIALLPFVDIAAIKAVYEELGPEKSLMNTLGKNYIYSHSAVVYTHRSTFGTIIKCTAERKVLT